MGTCELYKPLYKKLSVEDNAYAVIDSKQAHERANYYLLQAKNNEKDYKQARLSKNKVNYYLRIATDYGSMDAPFLLAHRILQKKAKEFSDDDVIIFLHIAAQRGHLQAALQMACCYDGKNSYPEILYAGADFFAALKTNERQLLAKYYYNVAMCEI